MTALAPSLQAHFTDRLIGQRAAAMALLHAGVDTAVIALWLGHADTRSTQIYHYTPT